MTEYSYMDIYTSHRIVDRIEKEDSAFRSLSQLLIEVKAYIEIMEQENIIYLEAKTKETVDAKNTYKFLRCQERTKNTKRILQYLSIFTVDLPMEESIVGKPVNPFLQLKMFTINSINLLKEKDVESAILKEHERLGLLNETNSWYYHGQIDKSHKALSDVVDRAQRADLEGYTKLFQGIRQMSMFWFSVRNQDIKRVRKSDLLMYKLTRYLLEKYKT